MNTARQTLKQSKTYWAVLGLANDEHEIVSLHETEHEARRRAELEAELNESYVSVRVSALV